MNHISPSSLSDWLTCNFKWFAKYILGISKTNEHALLGSAIDKYVCSNVISETGCTAEQVWEWLTNELKKINFNPISMELLFENIIDLCNKEVIPLLKEKKVIETQIKFNAYLKDIRLYGIIDFLFQDLSLGDLKTSSKTWYDGQELSEIQPKAYAQYIFEKYDDIDSVEFTFFVIVKNKTPKLDIRKVTITRKQSQDFYQFLANQVGNITTSLQKYIETYDKKQFAYNNRHFLCSKKYCPAWKLCQETFNIRIKD